MTETDMDLNVSDPDIVPDSGDVHHHNDELNEEYNMTQSTVGKQQLDRSSAFIKIMSSYMLLDGAGFRLLKEVAQGIEHYETYSGFCLTIEKSPLGRYHLYGCQIHMNCQFWFEHGSVVITMKNRNLIHSGIHQSTSMKDGRNMKNHHNRSFTSKHTHPVDVWVKQGCTCCNAQMGDLNQNNNKNILWQKTQKTQQSNKV